VLGDGTLLPTLREFIKDNNLEEMVVLHGRASETEVAQYMANADCLVVPSRNESLPLVLLEAAKSGLPSVATDVGDCKRLIGKYKIGYVAEAENPESLTRAMKKALLQGKTFKKTLGKNLKKVESDYNLKVAVDILLEATNKFATPQRRNTNK
jgi:glycosyltransferase involved in cell wall biosynthesis